jgi:hypothetical protein
LSPDRGIHLAQDVLGFEVAVCDPVPVQKREGRGDVTDDVPRLRFRHATLALQLLHECAALHLLEDHEEAVVLLEVLDQLEGKP